jgi:hypothetical protein
MLRKTKPCNVTEHVKEVNSTTLRHNAAAHQTARNNVTDIQISNTMGARPCADCDHSPRAPTAHAPDPPVGATCAPTHVLYYIHRSFLKSSF